jgi:hypothetical protein
MACRRISESLWSLVDKTTPGESISTMFLSRLISYIFLVTPGVFPTTAAFDRFMLLITDDFPTFGNPTIPTVISCLADP